MTLPAQTVRDSLAGVLTPEKRGAVNQELWASFQKAARDVVEGSLDMCVFEKLYSVHDIAMYSVDGAREVRLLLDVGCRGVMCGCTNGPVSECGKCEAVKITRIPQETVVVKEHKKGPVKVPVQKALPNSLNNVWTRPLEQPVLISGWLDASTALCFVDVRTLLRRVGCPRLVSSVLVPPPLPEGCVGVPRLLPHS